MAEVKKINKDICRMLREELNPILAKFGAKYGLKAEALNATYTSSQATFKLSFATLTPDGDVLDKDAESFRDSAELYGLQGSDLFRHFTSRGDDYKIVGLKSRSNRYPILCRKQRDGKLYKFQPDMVKLLLCQRS